MRLLKRTVSVVLSLIMIVSLFTIAPLTANAVTAVEYICRSWNSDTKQVTEETKTCADYTELSARSSDELAGGWYVVSESTLLENRLFVRYGKTVNLILKDGAYLNLHRGIGVDSGATLNIYGQSQDTGTLEVVFDPEDKYNKDNAVIGGTGENGNAGNISIHGGELKLSSFESYGAGIGGGSKGSPNIVSIYGGKISSATNSGGAGIGGGYKASASSYVGEGIRIYGGTIEATSYSGAGIGNGYYEDSSYGSIAIYGGSVNARSTNGGAGIGGGLMGANGKIYIYGGDITALAENSDGHTGAGIGSGANRPLLNWEDDRDINISGGTVSAVSEMGAGIGAGYLRNGCKINITGGTVFACSTGGAAGIGGGYNKSGGEINIQDAIVLAYSTGDVDQSLFQTVSSNMISAAQNGLHTLSSSLDGSGLSLISGAFSGLGAFFNANSGRGYGAGIGGGDKGKSGTINIKDSIIIARGGDLGSGIGCGKQRKYGNITIEDSYVEAVGGKDGAGIGGGNEAGPEDNAKIRIVGSTVKAVGGSEGSGIGSGNEYEKYGTIEIDSSTVEAHGGEYAAGIGGGDGGGDGTIVIEDSDVKAYGGTDAAGIGGGEGGDGGDIEISRSTVYAEGVDNGSGIGNGEDGDKTSVNILSGSQVTAWGGNGGGKAVGFADNGTFYSAHVSTYIDDTLKVEAGKNTDSADIYYKNDRYNAVWENRYAKIFGCPHTNTVWKYDNTSFHVKYCTECGYRLGSQAERHEWNSDNICTVCGGTAAMVTMTLKEKDSSGKEIIKSTTAPKYTDFTFPECKNVPDGYEFVCWKRVYYDGELGSGSYASGDTVEMYDETYKAIYLPLVETPYIAADGTEQTVRARVLDGSYEGLLLNNGWYVLTGNYTYHSPITIGGSVKLIVPDGVTFSSIGEDMRILYGNTKPSSIAIFGQREQTGTLDFGLNYFSCPAIKVYGGRINYQATTSFGGVYGTEIVRGTIDWGGGLSVPKAGVTISGGNLNFSGQTILTGELQLGWTKLTDSVRFARTMIISNPKNHGRIVIAENQAFKDEAGNIYTGALTDDQISAIQGKTLTPCLLHNYGEPEWNWSNEYKDASALFRCVDDGCDDKQIVDAKVTYEDKDNIRTSTATCELNGNTYTTTRSGRIRWNVNVGNCAHGTVTVDESTAKAGEAINLSVTPDEGYSLKSLTVTDTDDNPITVTDNTFIMPASDVTVSAEFIKPVEKVEPYIDDEGEYHLGTVEHFELDGKNYAVAEDGSIGEELDSLDLSYFDFVLNGDKYQIEYYTGPYDNLTELVIPKTFDDKPITVLGTDNDDRFMRGYGEKPQFNLVLNENITEIKKYSFYTQDVKEVKGNTSGLNTIGSYAFSWGNSPDNFNIDIKLDYEGTITCDSYIFNHRNATLRLKHSTRLSKTTPYNLGAQSVNYIFTDAHTYGEPEWKWADDYSSAKATFTCTDTRCKHTEKIDATVTKADSREKTDYTATVEFENETYTDTQTVNKTQSGITVNSSENGAVSADKEQAYEGEEVTLTITPDTGYKLSSLAVKDENNGDIEVSGNKFVMPDSAVTVSATFEEKSYDITYAETESGWVKGAYSANFNEEVELNVIPCAGYEVDTVTVKDDNENIIPVENNKFTMPASNVSVSATFKKRNLNISYYTDGNGTITGAETAQLNDRVPLTVTPNEGYILNNLYAEDSEYGDPATILNEDGYELIMSDTDITVYAEFIPYTPASEPYIDENGEYHLGNVAYFDAGDGTYYAVENGKLGEELESVDVSYFDFTENGDTYQINYYSGPTDNLTELVIPKTFKGKPITVLGTDNRSAFVPNSNPKPQFILTLNENVREIKGYAFYTMWVKKVQGDTSNLSIIGDYAFSWVNGPDDFKLDIKLDYEGNVNVGREIFNHMNVTARIKHATQFSRSGFSQQSINYIFTDAHTYGEPEWTWADDYSTATATFTCTDSRCKHDETVDATVTSIVASGKNTYTATVTLNEQTYTDTKSVDLTAINYKYNVYDEGTSQLVEKIITKTVNPSDYSVQKLIELNEPKILSQYREYGGYTYEVSGNTINVQITDTEKKYTVYLDGDEAGEYSYLDTCTLNTTEEKAFIVDGKVVYIGTSYSFYVGGDTDVTTEEPTDKTVAEYANINLNSYIIDGDRVTLDMLATANVEKGKYRRMGVAFALGEKTEDEITAAVQTVTTGTGTTNKIAVHNSKVDQPNQSEQFQFRYAPYFSRDKAKDAIIYFYTYVVTDDGIKVSDAAQYNMRNLLA